MEEPWSRMRHVPAYDAYDDTHDYRPTLHIKDELSEDEFIDVVNCFQDEDPNAEHFQYYNQVSKDVPHYYQECRPKEEEGTQVEFECNTQRNGNEYEQRMYRPLQSQDTNFRDEIKILKPNEINMDFEKHVSRAPAAVSRKYEVLRQQLSNGSLDKDIVMSRNLNNQIEKQVLSSALNKQRVLAQAIRGPLERNTAQGSHDPLQRVTDQEIRGPFQRATTQGIHDPLQRVRDQESPLYLERTTAQESHDPLQRVTDPESHPYLERTTTQRSHDPLERVTDQECHPYLIHPEVAGSSTGCSVENMTLRYRVLVFLWVLLGESRLFKVGYPSAPIHVVLWRVVHTCCAVAGVKSAAAVPLPPGHDCGLDMLCFRDHVHRMLEVCAPTRDHWKQFGWASLTVDAVVGKIYKQELCATLGRHALLVPATIRMAMGKLARLERAAADLEKLPEQRAQQPRWRRTVFRGHVPRVATAEKKKRGRPLKVNRVVPDTSGKIERVMLWRFVLNLLEEPGNAACIHWLNREEGIFRILNTDWLARIWGRRHGNPRMTYEKMARAMRTYYRSKVLQPVPRNKNLPRKLVYRFNPALVRRVTAM